MWAAQLRNSNTSRCPSAWLYDFPPADQDSFRACQQRAALQTSISILRFCLKHMYEIYKDKCQVFHTNYRLRLRFEYLLQSIVAYSIDRSRRVVANRVEVCTHPSAVGSNALIWKMGARGFTKASTVRTMELLQSKETVTVMTLANFH